MPNDEEEFIGRKAFVTGWGRLKYGMLLCHKRFMYIY
jgi:hypothetical protein